MVCHKPILKWVGGKTQIIDKVIENFPKKISNYHEVCLGGGSVLFALLTNKSIIISGVVYAYDINEPLIYVYKNIQMYHNELYDVLQNIIKDFNDCGDGIVNRTPTNLEEAKVAKENYYYWIRSRYNKLSSVEKTSLLGSALFIFLNKTCFRGVFRVGPNGFNVPYGHYNNPEIVNKDHLADISNLIKNVEFNCSCFRTSLANVEDGDFVYIDPPYAPETKTSFVGYTASGFNNKSHTELFSLIHKLTEKKIKVVMSNSNVSLVRDSFSSTETNPSGVFSCERYKIVEIVCNRYINSKKPNTKATEVLIINY